MEDLNDDNFMIYAAKAYHKVHIISAEFDEDINRIQYIKRLISRYLSTKELKERLILNHLRIFYNVFGPEPGTRLLFLKMDKRDLEVLKPFLIYLSMLPEVVHSVRGKNLNTALIKLDKNAIQALRELK